MRWSLWVIFSPFKRIVLCKHWVLVGGDKVRKILFIKITLLIEIIMIKNI